MGSNPELLSDREKSYILLLKVTERANIHARAQMLVRHPRGYNWRTFPNPEW